MQIAEDARIFRPQEGPQKQFLASSADFCLYGGAAGGGKTFGLALECLRYHLVPKARVLVFRRQSVDIEKPGGLWDEMSSIYPMFGAKPNKVSHTWTFPSGMEVTCSHLNAEKDKYSYQGAQGLAAILFDELTHFTETQFWYMFSRARNTYGVRPYIKASCNPEPGWVADFIDWYIGQDGLVKKDRAGAVRYFLRQGNTCIWGASPEEVADKTSCDEKDIKSFQFIPASIEDNKILMANGGREYIANLKLIGEVESQRLLYGNWKVKREGKVFKQNEFMIYTRLPIDCDCYIMTVDTAQKTKEENDYSVLQIWARRENKVYFVDQVRGKYQYPDLKMMTESFVEKHRQNLNAIFIEDKVSGTGLIQDLKRTITVPIFAIQRNTDKYSRAYDVQGYVSAGHVYVNPMMSYYPEFISEIVSFTADNSHSHDDQVDCMIDAIDKLLINPYRPTNFSANNRESSDDGCKFTKIC
jgi:predicted phage terminase large subunit-like protein